MNISEYGVSLDAEELRDIIQGKMSFRRCPECEGEGTVWCLHYVLADDPNEIEDQKSVGAQFAADFLVDDHPQYSYGECRLYDCYVCHGVGYIPADFL
jgi:hypothetical protein